MAGYRLCLVWKGGKAERRTAQGPWDDCEEKLSEVIRSGGKVEMSELPASQVRYFSDGMAIGSKLFLKELYDSNRDCFPESRSCAVCEDERL